MNFSKLEFTWPLDKPLASWAPLFLASSHNSCAQCWKIMHQVSLSILTLDFSAKTLFLTYILAKKMLKTRRISSGFQPYKFLENDLIFKIWLLRVNHTNLCKMRVVTWESKSEISKMRSSSNPESRKIWASQSSSKSVIGRFLLTKMVINFLFHFRSVWPQKIKALKSLYHSNGFALFKS